MSDPSVLHDDSSYQLPTGGKPYASTDYDDGELAAMQDAKEGCNTATVQYDSEKGIGFVADSIWIGNDKVRSLSITPGSASPVNPPETSSGGDNDYWIAEITNPKRLTPYKAECEDLIELFQMSFQEGEAFKALWRNGQMRIGNGKPGDSHLRNAEKVAHFGSRMVAMEQRKHAALSVGA